MFIYEFFKKWFSSNNQPQVQACPNCWGRYEWDNAVKPINIDFEKDRSDIGRARKTFIRKFVDRYVPGRKSKNVF